MNQIIQDEELEQNSNPVEAKVIEKETNQKVVEKEEKFTSNENKKTTARKEKNERKKLKIGITIAAIILVVLLTLSTIFSIINISNKNILKGITINKIKVEGLSKEEAVDLLKNEMQKTEKFIASYNGKDYSIIKEDLNIEYNFNKAVEEAYSQGRGRNIFVNNFNIANNMFKGKNIVLETKISEQGIQEEANKINEEIPNGLVESSYSIEENKLIIKKGTPGNGVDVTDFAKKIKTNIDENSSQKIVLQVINQQPKEIDIEKIRDEIYKEPKNAYFEKNPFKVYPHVEGIDINIEEAKKILAEEKEEYVIPLVITKPEITTDQIGTEAFPNLLGRCTTKYDESNVSRSTNLKVATKTINGKVLMPGEVFSYNGTLGERTYAKGYRLGHGYVGGKNVDMIGGGICQISSTLYNAAIYANLGIVERHAHAHIAAYLDPGKDATVSYGTLDFKFKNTRKNPVMIKASAKNGIATVEIYGLKEEQEYEIQIVSYVANYIGFKTIYEDDPTKDVGYEKVTQKGMRGCNSSTYKIYKLNGVEVKKELLSKDSFAPMHKYITRGTKGANQAPAETPTTPNTPTTPSTPTTPEAPTTPTEPEVPSTPTEPETPTIPDNPTTP